ncbi:MAG: hypothetical protein ACI8R4_003299, partial [Paracoccaceae bacterium]
NASSATLALNWSENFRRFVILVFLLHVGIHLNRLSDFAGPLQNSTIIFPCIASTKSLSAWARIFPKAHLSAGVDAP